MESNQTDALEGPEEKRTTRREFLKKLPYIPPVIETFLVGAAPDAEAAKGGGRGRGRGRGKGRISPPPKRKPPPPPKPKKK